MHCNLQFVHGWLSSGIWLETTRQSGLVANEKREEKKGNRKSTPFENSVSWWFISILLCPQFLRNLILSSHFVCHFSLCVCASLYLSLTLFMCPFFFGFESRTTTTKIKRPNYRQSFSFNISSVFGLKIIITMHHNRKTARERERERD